METLVACPNCGAENRAVHKICHSCFYTLKSLSVPVQVARNTQIVVERDENKMTFKEIATKQGISIERVRQIYGRAQRRKAMNDPTRNH